MKTKAISFISIIFILLTVSCSKYEDGPIISFRSKATRLEGSWKYESKIYIDQNIIVTENLPDTIMVFTKNGDYSENSGYTGTWKFTGTVDLLITKTQSGVTIEDQWEILKLSNKQLWLRKSNIEHRFVPE
jgi:hypothetical protein